MQCERCESVADRPVCSRSFPPDSVDKSAFTDSQTHTTCGWKGALDRSVVIDLLRYSVGVASYYNAKLDDGTVTCEWRCDCG